MKKILLCLVLCLAMVTSVLAAGNTKHVPMSQDTTNRVMHRLSGEWYDSKGDVALTIKNNTINGCELLGASDFAGGDPGEGLFQVKTANGERDMRIGWYTYQNGGEHNYLVIDNQTTLRRTKAPQYYESIGGIYLGMSKNSLAGLYGQPSRIVRNSWYYDGEGLRVNFQGDMATAVVMYSSSNHTLDQSKLNCHDSLEAFYKAYHLDRMPKVSTEPYNSYGSYDIGHGEFLYFDNYPNTIVLTVYYN